MKALYGAALLLLLAARPLAGQMVVTNDTLDTERQEVRDILIVLRDSLRTVEAAAAQFQRGHQSASTELLYSRGRALQRACVRSVRNVEPARETVEAGAWDSEYRTETQKALLDEMTTLEQALLACDSVWERLASLDDPDDLRTDGPVQAESIAEVIHQYSTAVSAFYKALGIYVRPIGAGPGILP
jgi:hypothetical protein